MRAWLFRMEMRFRSIFHLDCTQCLQREIDRVDNITLPPGRFRVRALNRSGFQIKGATRDDP